LGQCDELLEIHLLDEEILFDDEGGEQVHNEHKISQDLKIFFLNFEGHLDEGEHKVQNLILVIYLDECDEILLEDNKNKKYQKNQ